MGRKRIAVEPAETIQKAFKFFKARHETVVKKGAELARLSGVDVVVLVKGFGECHEFLTDNAKACLGDHWETVKRELQLQSPVEHQKFRRCCEHSRMQTTRSTNTQHTLDTIPAADGDLSTQQQACEDGFKYDNDEYQNDVFSFSSLYDPYFTLDLSNSPPSHSAISYRTPLSVSSFSRDSSPYSSEEDNEDLDYFLARKKACLRKLDILSIWK